MKEKRCQFCKELLPRDAEKRDDPYEREIHDKSVDYGYWCNACYRERSDEI